jgi:ABC-type cobalamin/Fe3+-siderophores transport system ATPase subunit
MQFGSGIRYTDHLVALAGRHIHATGTPEQVLLTEENVLAIFGLDSKVITDAHLRETAHAALAATTPSPKPASRTFALLQHSADGWVEYTPT